MRSCLGFSLACFGPVALSTIAACSATTDDEKVFVPGDTYPAQDGGTESAPPDATQDTTQPKPDTGLDACVQSTYIAKQTPLAMYVMMDASGSMLDAASGTQQSKWDSVLTAMQSFLQDDKSKGVGFGIQFFPLQARAPQVCSIQDRCPDQNICILPTPQDMNGLCYQRCDTADCPNTDCVQIGFNSVCANENCDVMAYATPDVEIASLPDVGPKLMQAVQNRTPFGGTPTRPALQGALVHAGQWEEQHKDHKIIVVLATDGKPTLCPPASSDAEVQAIVDELVISAQTAFEGPSAIRTFVVGVMKEGEDTRKSLDAIAAAGGTGESFVIDPTTDVAAQFGVALERIRGEAIGCEYLLPALSGMDYGGISVDYVRVDQTTTAVAPVSDLGQCNATSGGWYFDSDPTQSPPTSIVLCSATCRMVKNDAGGQGQVRLGVGCKN